MSLSEQREFLNKVKRKEHMIPGLGQCLWMSIFAGLKQQNVFIPDISKDHLNEFHLFKQSLYHRLQLFLPNDAQQVHLPLIDNEITQDKQKQFSEKEKMNLIDKYFSTVISTPVTTNLPKLFWGSSLSVELAVQVIEKPIYILEFNSILQNSLLHSYTNNSVTIEAGVAAQVFFFF